MTKQKKGFLLGGLFVLWGILMFTQFSGESPPSGVSFSPMGLSPQPGQTPEKPTDLAHVLNSGRLNVTFSNPRNIFAPLTWKTPKPPPPKRQIKTSRCEKNQTQAQNAAPAPWPITWRVSSSKGPPATQHIPVPGIPQKRRKKPSIPD